MKTQQAYKEVLEVLNKHKALIAFDIRQLEVKAKNHLFGLELVEKHGFDLDPMKIDGTEYQRLKDDVHLTFIDGKKYIISWPDDGKQPQGEMLLRFSYPTGPYVFGDDYPVEFFHRFFSELKSYGPKYLDSANKSLYFALDNAGKIFNDYDSIVMKYREENKADRKQREIKAMKSKLAALESAK